MKDKKNLKIERNKKIIDLLKQGETIVYVADIMNMSRTYVANTFYFETGKSLREFRNEPSIKKLYNSGDYIYKSRLVPLPKIESRS